MLRPTAKAVTVKDNYILDIEFDNGEKKEFDVKPYIKGEWYGKLQDINYFKAVETDGFTVVWPDGQDICPDELYELSKTLVLVQRDMSTEKKRPQDRWNEKAGLVSKSYKLKRELTEEFATTCDVAGVSQAGQISKMMREFIDEVQANV